MKRPDNSLVKFNFMVKTYYRSVQLGTPKEHEVAGVKTLKLFKSWFRLMKNRNRLLFGVIRFADGETWIWQNPKLVYHGDWQRALPPRNEKPYQLRLL